MINLCLLWFSFFCQLFQTLLKIIIFAWMINMISKLSNRMNNPIIEKNQTTQISYQSKCSTDSYHYPLKFSNLILNILITSISINPFWISDILYHNYNQINIIKCSKAWFILNIDINNILRNLIPSLLQNFINNVLTASIPGHILRLDWIYCHPVAFFLEKISCYFESSIKSLIFL